MNNPALVVTQPLKRRPVLTFFLIVYLLTAAAIPLASSLPGLLPFVLVIIPVITAIALAAVLKGWSGVRKLLGRVTIGCVSWQRYQAVLGLPILGSLLMVGVRVALGAPSAGQFDKLPPTALIVLAVALIPALLEELGFRSFALAKLLEGG